jgi:hypothetical protein
MRSSFMPSPTDFASPNKRMLFEICTHLKNIAQVLIPFPTRQSTLGSRSLDIDEVISHRPRATRFRSGHDYR